MMPSLSASTADRCLIQNEDRRVPEQRAGDRNALPLSAGQTDAAFADHRAIALRQPGYEVMGIGRLGRGVQLSLRRVGLAHAQIVFDRAVEQICILVYHCDLAADLIERPLAQVPAADQDPAALGVVKPQQQSCDRCLARSARPNDTDPLAGLEVETQSCVCRPPAAWI